jgi:transcriptional regulator with XRE-family HTH domain
MYMQHADTSRAYTGDSRLEEVGAVALSPAASRRRLGMELRNLREQAGLLIEDAAATLECSTAKISRLENGKGRPFQRDVRDLLALYAPAGQGREQELYELAEAGRQSDWIDDYREFLQGEVFHGQLAPDSGGRFVTMERDASELKLFECDYVPGLFQSAEYIEAICRYSYPDRPERELRNFIRLRLKRQEAVLDRRDHARISVVMSELVALRRAVPAEILSAQLWELVKRLRGELNWVNFRVTNLIDEPHAALGGPFHVIKFADPNDQDVVYLEGREEPDYLESDTAVLRYESFFNSLEKVSLPRADSLDRLLEIAARLE